MEDLGATKTLQKVKFGVVWDKLKAKKISKTNIQKIFEINSSFHVK